jgi:hypothetical protein
MEQSKNVIKRTYDSYINSDYKFGTEDATTLNPKREIKFDQIEVIRKRLQEVTDDIIRKKMAIEPPSDKPITASLSPGYLPDRNSLLRQAAQINTGSIGLGVLFPVIDGPEGGFQNILEPIIGTFPLPLILSELDHPLSLDCDAILKQYDMADNDGDDDSDDNDGDGDSDGDSDDSDDGGGDDSDGGGDDSDGDDDDGDGDDDSDEFKECAMIEMEWLKIILIILRIIKILQILLDLILAIIVPLLEIVMLALICWIVPPAAEQLRQRITEMVMAIIIMIITKLLAMIFSLLNLDCLCDQTTETINQIRQALSAFHSIMSVFNVKSVNMMINNATDQLKDPLDQIADIFNKKQEAWGKLKDEYKNLDIKDMWEKSKQDIMQGAVKAVSTDPNIQKVNQTVKATASALKMMGKDIVGIISDMKKMGKATLGTPPPVPEPGAATVENMLRGIGTVQSE